VRVAIGLALLLLAAPVGAEEKGSETFTDPTYGYSFNYPSYWILRSDQTSLDRVINGGNPKGTLKNDGPMKFRFVLFAKGKSSDATGSNLLLGVVQFKKADMDREALLKGTREGLADEKCTVSDPEPIRIGSRDVDRFELKPKKEGSFDFQEHYIYIDERHFRLYDFSITTDPGSPDIGPLEATLKSLHFTDR
jgi:hypothetical protein